MSRLARIIAERKALVDSYLPVDAFVSLVLIYDPWRGYDPVRDVELLAQWLGPFKPATIPATPIPALLRGWPMLALSRITSLHPDQLYTIILAQTSKEKSS